MRTMLLLVILAVRAVCHAEDAGDHLKAAADAFINFPTGGNLIAPRYYPVEPPIPNPHENIGPYFITGPNGRLTTCTNLGSGRFNCQ